MNSSRLVKVASIAIPLIVLACLALFAILGFGLWRNLQSTANLNTAVVTPRTFVEQIHDGNIGIAYSMLSEEFKPHPSRNEFSALIRKDEQIFDNYTKLDICDWGLFLDNGVVIEEQGLLYYGTNVIAVQVSLHKDVDNVWRIQGFRFDSDAATKPYGLCS